MFPFGSFEVTSQPHAQPYAIVLHPTHQHVEQQLETILGDPCVKLWYFVLQHLNCAAIHRNCKHQPTQPLSRYLIMVLQQGHLCSQHQLGIQQIKQGYVIDTLPHNLHHCYLVDQLILVVPFVLLDFLELHLIKLLREQPIPIEDISAQLLLQINGPFPYPFPIPSVFIREQHNLRIIAGQINKHIICQLGEHFQSWADLQQLGAEGDLVAEGVKELAGVGWPHRQDRVYRAELLAVLLRVTCRHIHILCILCRLVIGILCVLIVIVIIVVGILCIVVQTALRCILIVCILIAYVLGMPHCFGLQEEEAPGPLAELVYFLVVGDQLHCIQSLLALLQRLIELSQGLAIQSLDICQSIAQIGECPLYHSHSKTPAPRCLPRPISQHHILLIIINHQYNINQHNTLQQYNQQYIQQQQMQMEVEAWLSEQPLPKLINQYISGDAPRETQTQLLNSILIGLVSGSGSGSGRYVKQHGHTNSALSYLLSQCKYALQANGDDRNCNILCAQLLREVCKRSAWLISKAPPSDVVQVIAFACDRVFITVCGNDYIALLAILIEGMQVNQQQQQQHQQQQQQQSTAALILKVLRDNRMHAGSYRQQTRLNIYKLMSWVLHLRRGLKKQQPGLLKQYPLLILQSTQSEKDPRNITLVFSMYLEILNTYPTEELTPYLPRIFQSLSAYYPIDFAGDEGEDIAKGINLKEISALLDQSICHPLLASLTYPLLSSKVCQPPIHKYIPTLIKFISRNPSAVNSHNLLIKLTQDEYLQEEEEQGQGQHQHQHKHKHQHQHQHQQTPNIGGLMRALLQTIKPTIAGYEVLERWCASLIGDKIMKSKDNAKHSSKIIAIIKCILAGGLNKLMFNKNMNMKMNNKNTITYIPFILSYSIHKFIIHHDSQGQLTPKLALLLVTSGVSHLLPSTDTLSHLILTLGNIYNSASLPNRLITLRILMSLHSLPSLSAMVRKVNNSQIQAEILTIIKQVITNGEAAITLQPSLLDVRFVLKSYIEYAVSVYLHIVSQTILSSQTISSSSSSDYCQYLLLRVFLAIHQGQSNSQLLSVVVAHLKTSLLSPFPSFLSAIKMCLPLKTLIKLLVLANIQGETASMRQVITAMMDKELINEEEYDAFYQQQSQHQNVLRFILTPSKEDPTAVHHRWQQIIKQEGQIEDELALELIPQLPPVLLHRDHHFILVHLCRDQRNVCMLAKIIPSVQQGEINKYKLVDYCKSLLFNQITHPALPVAHLTSIFVILLEIHKKMQSTLALQIKQNRKEWVNILSNLKLHRKRPVRQACRRLAYLFQAWIQ